MDVYKGKIQSDGSLDKLKLIIVVGGHPQNKELVGDTRSSTCSMITLKYSLADSVKHKARVYQLYFIGALLQEKVKNRVFVKLDSRYAYYFPEYSIYFGRGGPRFSKPSSLYNDSFKCVHTLPLVLLATAFNSEGMRSIELGGLGGITGKGRGVQGS